MFLNHNMSGEIQIRRPGGLVDIVPIPAGEILILQALELANANATLFEHTPSGVKMMALIEFDEFGNIEKQLSINNAYIVGSTSYINKRCFGNNFEDEPPDPPAACA